MAAITAAVVSTGLAVSNANRQKRAQQRAADDQRRANLESAQLLERAGREGEADIIRQATLAADTLEQATEAAIDPIEMFANEQAVMDAQEQIISNLPVSGAIADSIRQASTEFIKSRPEFNLTSPVAGELDRQASLAVSGATPQFSDAMLAAGQQGLAGIVDVSQAQARGSERLGNIAGAQAAQRAGVLVGQAPQLAQLASSSREAGLLSDIAGQRARGAKIEAIAGLGGQLSGIFRG